VFQANYTWVRKWLNEENIYCTYIYMYTLKEWGVSKEYGFLIFIPLNKIGDYRETSIINIWWFSQHFVCEGCSYNGGQIKHS
jgi:hypothetical protein